MDLIRYEIAARETFDKGRALGIKGKYEQALFYFDECIDNFPETQEHLEEDYTKCVLKLGSELYESNSVPKLFQIFEKALSIYPSNSKIMNAMGLHLFHLGYLDKACGIFYKAHNLDAGFAMAERNLNQVKSMLVERWHFRMLNDLHRNNLYKEAISATVGQKDVVLDVGTGSGLLSIFAFDNKPKALIACEESEALYRIAEKIFAKKKILSNERKKTKTKLCIKAINKLSTDLTMSDISERITLLITEIFDAAVFGEGILQTLIHAYGTLLSPNGRVLPMGVSIFACGIQSTYIASKRKVLKRDRTPLNLNNINSYSALDEPYDTENLRQIKDLKYLTTVNQVLKVDFNNFKEVKGFFSGQRKGDLISLMITEGGRLDAIAVWFTLHLAEGIDLSTDPRLNVEIPAWDQAIFPTFHHVDVAKDDNLQVQFSCEGGSLQLICPMFSPPKGSFTISDMMVRFLNDGTYIGEISDAVSALSVYLENVTDVHVLDLSPVPVLGFLMLERGAQHLTCVVENLEEQKFFKEIAEQNNIDFKKLAMFRAKDFEISPWINKYHVIITHLFEVCGEMCKVGMDLADGLKKLSLAPGGVMLPFNVNMSCKLVFAPWLESTNKVDFWNLPEYDIADYMNAYHVTQNICLNEYTLDFDEAAGPIIFFDNSNPSENDVIDVKLDKDCSINAVYCYSNIQLLENGSYISTSRPDSFMDSVAYTPKDVIEAKKGDTVCLLICTDDDGTMNIKIHKD